jgi:hypothetical protein
LIGLNMQGLSVPYRADCAIVIELKDLFSGLAIFASALIAVIGWSKAAKKDREQLKFQRRLEKRIGMLTDVVEAITPIINHSNPAEADPLLAEKLSKARLSVQLYGYRNEIGHYEGFVRAIETGSSDGLSTALHNLVPSIRRQIRKELGYDESEIDVTEMPTRPDAI